MKWLLALGAILLALPVLQALPQGEAALLSDGAATYKALSKEYSTARSAYYTEYRGLSEDPEAQKELVPPLGIFLPQFIANAETFAGTDDAIPFLIWTVENAPDGHGDDAEIGNRSIATLLSAHIESEALESFATKLARLSYPLGAERCRATIDKVIAKSPHQEVRLQAMFSRAQIVLRDDESTAADNELAGSDLRAIVADSTNKNTVERAEGCIFELENLQIGMVAPEIESEDLDGVMFKLSDYRGKVVVLDFWGDW